MPLYKGTIYKSSTVYGYQWSNVYTLSCFDKFNALEVISNIMVLEKAISYSTVKLFRVHVVNLADKNDQATNVFGGAVGDLDPTGLGGPLPLFCTIRCVFTDAVKKPEQKYLRLGANEANLTLGQWDGEFVSFVIDNYVTPLIANTQFVGPSGEAHLEGNALSPVQNRQLGWHRRHRPGMKRGWVPA